MAAVIAGAFAVGAGPASYAMANVGHALNGNNVLAGPSSVGQGGFGGGPGGGGDMRGGIGGGQPPTGAGAPPNGGTPPTGMRGGGSSVSDEMLTYLEANQGGAKYLVAVSGSQASAPIIIETGKAVVTMGGFSGQDNAPTVSQLEEMVSDGELEYVLLGGRGNGTVDTWVTEHGTLVDGFENLYEVTV